MSSSLEFLSSISALKPQTDTPISSFTTWKIGGKAQYLVKVNCSSDLVLALRSAQKFSIPVTVLGGGSNTLLPDEGLSGLVIIYRDSKDITVVQPEIQYEPQLITHRHSEEKSSSAKPYSFDDLDYVENEPRGLLKLSAAVNLNYAIIQTIKLGYTGLQFFAGIPGTVGGALFNNIHGGTKHFSEYFFEADILDLSDPELKIQKWDLAKFDFAYDQSKLRDLNNIIVLDIYLALHKGDTQRAKETATEWMRRKRVQPRNTAGCTFKNIPLGEQQRLDWPTPSVGYLIDKILNYKGREFGTVKISDWHANFIESDSQHQNSKAKDVLSAIQEVSRQAKTKFALELEPEVSIITEPKWSWDKN